VADLRSALDRQRSQGDLIETDKPVDPDLEITGLQKHMDGGCPVLFNNVKGKPHHRVVTNLFGDMKVINKMFGWKDDAERVKKLAYALRRPLEPAEIPQQDAPCGVKHWPTSRKLNWCSKSGA
jgi:gallate decarboxylase subunit C